jgi:hypothetical protein
MTRRCAGRRAVRGGWSIAGLLLAAPLVGCALSSGAPDQAPAASQAAAPADDPDHLIGLDAGRLQGMFGPPGLVRSDAPAEIWQYSTHACVLDLFLYQDKDGMRLRYLEARDRAAQSAAARNCVDAVLALRDRSVRAS